MECPLSFKKNNLIDYVIINNNNWNNIEIYKKGCLYFILLEYETKILKIFEFISKNIDINQIHFINLDNTNKNGISTNIYENIIRMISENDIMFNMSIQHNNIETINLQTVPDHSLLHISNNLIIDPSNIFQSNFEILKIDWFYLSSYKISNNIKCISFYIKYPDKTFKFLLDSLYDNYSLQCIEFIFLQSYKITNIELEKIKIYQSITFYNVDFSLIKKSILNNATKMVSFICCCCFKLNIKKELSIIKIVNCNKYKLQYLHNNTILLINQNQYFNTKHKKTCFISKKKKLFFFVSKYYKILLEASGSLFYKHNSMFPNGGSNILPFIMTDAGKLSGIIQFGTYWCINHVTLAPFTINDILDVKSLSDTITMLKKEKNIKKIIVRLPNDDVNKVIQLLELNNMEYIIDKLDI